MARSSLTPFDDEATARARRPPSRARCRCRRLWRDRSTCCSTSRGSQKVDLRRSRSSRWPTSTSPTSSGEALQLELAADYLVMAAWLAYLKSRRCCRPRTSRRARARGTSSPRRSPSGSSGSGDARRRGAAVGRDQLGRDVFLRRRARGLAGRPQEPVAVRLVLAGFRLRPGQGARRAGRAHGPRPHGDDARIRARTGLGAARRRLEWIELRDFLPVRAEPRSSSARRSPRASSPRSSSRASARLSCARRTASGRLHWGAQGSGP